MMYNDDMGKNNIQKINEWKRNHTKTIIFYINKDTESDVLQHLESQPNRRAYLVELIRKDMNEQTPESDKSEI